MRGRVMIEFVSHYARAPESYKRSVEAVTRPIIKTRALATTISLAELSLFCEVLLLPV